MISTPVNWHIRADSFMISGNIPWNSRGVLKIPAFGQITRQPVPWKPVNPDHQSYGRVLSYVIVGHHGGLLNFGSVESGLEERLRRTSIPDYSSDRDEIALRDQNLFQFALKPLPKKSGFLSLFFHTITILMPRGCGLARHGKIRGSGKIFSTRDITNRSKNSGKSSMQYMQEKNSRCGTIPSSTASEKIFSTSVLRPARYSLEFFS